ncbi:SbcC/MukB-like Walker B domain-containing protein [Blastococcus sp. BMG 814]|uniref:SbcC/MukB-like Walker B domain-containing protein n=1 Tax=Blastococcus carthaginiensis TaxID=3050034 RepID=A0ABT9IGY4_9ACTN|nr:SbcC/MukB-like Walker B domain-containing protein [Blastococcus carthaginiensis]MDP5184830.1 SbcC/MukB-like Walker B domain-containing protein [Blastococcus carthaginiensis]
MTTTVPMSTLTGVPEPTRGRWEPLRAGIVNLFRYDEQTFTFHRGRLLIRGNNGSGKSMALEVLLPFVFDADLTPSKLSTFGGNNRNMYLWLIGFDKTGTRTSERAYVWVEFGRQTADGTGEFFTAGAMLEGTRGGDVKPTYFTTNARIGVDLSVGSPGREPLNKNALAKELEQHTAAGRPGKVHADARSHRTAVNAALFHMPDKRFDALRGTLRQLRRPKLSDKLDEAELNRVLRDSLPPVADATVADLAEGFERLDRHAAAVTELTATIEHLGSLRDSYRRYARAAVAARADAVAAAETGIESVRDRATAAQAAVDAATGELKTIGARRDVIGERTSRISGRMAALQESEAFTEGADLEPLRELVAALETEAGAAAGRAQRAQQEATRDAATSDRRTQQAENAVAALTDARAVAADAAGGAHTTGLDAELAESVAQLRASDVADDVALDAAVTAARGLTDELSARLSPWAGEVGKLVSLAAAAADKHTRAAAAHAETERADSDVAAVEEALNTALDGDRATMLGWLDELTTWAADSPQLRAGQAPPLPWEPATAAEFARRWAREAAAARTAALLELQTALGAIVSARAEAASRAQAAAESLEALAEMTDRAAAAAAARDAAGVAFRTQVGQWTAGLVELPQAAAVPDWSAVADLRLAAAARNWAAAAAADAAQQLHRVQAGLEARRGPLTERIEELTAAEEHLAAGGLPQLPVPATRGADRTGRAGAPLYLLVEFADTVPAHEHLGIEAATIGAGLADAWLSPDGTLRSADGGGPLLDTQLIADVPPVASSLAGVLVPADSTGHADTPVPADVVTAVLSRIACLPSATGTTTDAPDASGGLVIGADGTWRAGALAGAHRVSDVTLLGAAAREADRRAKLAAVRAELGELTAAVTDLNGQLTVVQQRLAATDAERGAVADDEELRDAEAAASRSAAAVTERAEGCAAQLRAATTDVAPLPVGVAVDAHDDAGARAVQALAEHAGPAVAAVAGQPAAGHGPALREAAGHAAVAAQAWQAAAIVREQAAAAVREDLAAVGRERDALPADDAVTTARAALHSPRAALQVAGQRLAERQAEESRARSVAIGADEARDAALAGAGLPAGTDPAALAAAVRGYRAAAERWLRAAADTVRATGAAALALRASLSSADDAAQAQAAATAAAGAYAQADERLKTKTERFGAEYADIVDDLARLQGERTNLLKELEDLAKTEREQLIAQATAQATLGAVAAARIAAETARAAAHEAFLAAARLGLLAVAGLAEAAGADLPAGGEGGQGGDGEPADGGLGLRAVRTAARAVRDAVGDRLPRSAEAVEAAANRVHERRYELDPLLANGGVSVRDEQRASLMVLHAVRGGRSLPLLDMIGALGEDRDTAAGLVAAEEAELFRRFLADDTRREVTSRVRDARTQVTQMARLMAAHPTGSGLRVQLRWAPDETNAPGMQEIVKLMAKDAPLESEKERLADFFRARVAQVRANAEVDYTAQLAELLDYRQWWKFVVEFQRGSETGWTPLTGKAHGALSGGEKAVCLHLPLFAAAASYSDNAPLRFTDGDGSERPGAPRLILLDEVFAGVDEDNRGELFELIGDLDLDLVATSESERGLYPQLDGLSIYQLYASDTAVLAARSVWDGAAEHNLLEDDLLSDLGGTAEQGDLFS